MWTIGFPCSQSDEVAYISLLFVYMSMLYLTFKLEVGHGRRLDLCCYFEKWLLGFRKNIWVKGLSLNRLYLYRSPYVSMRHVPIRAL